MLLMFFIGIAAAAGGFVLFFNRDPLRTPPEGGVILSPADGKVIEISINDHWEIIVIFMNIFNVHVQWVPYNGDIISITRESGPNLIAFHPEARHNQRVTTVIKTRIGEIMVKQITGIFARRIKTHPKVGDKIMVGQRFGKITLGSRVELWLPKGKTSIHVKVGDKVLAGITVMALPKG